MHMCWECFNFFSRKFTS